MKDSRHCVRVLSQSGFKLEEIELLEIAAFFFLKELEKIKKINKIQCEVVIVGEISSEATNEQLSGDMIEIKNHILDNGTKTNYYVCRISDFNNSAETMRTLAHELIHVWQTENGSLRTSDDGEWFWKSKSYGYNPYDGTIQDDYLPWEQEAATMDLKLTRKFYSTYFLN